MTRTSLINKCPTFLISRHKTVKQEFRGPYFLAIGANVVGLAGLAFTLVSPGSRAQALAQARKMRLI